MNVGAVNVEQYTAWVLDWSEKKLKAMDVKTRKTDEEWSIPDTE